MPAVAFLILAAGAWLLESALKNRAPLQTLIAVVQNPQNARQVTAHGSALTVPATSDVVGTPGGPATTFQGGPAQIAVNYCRTQIGKPYVLGGTGPDGFDCSGLVWRAYYEAGVWGKPRVPTQVMVMRGVKVDRANLQLGDLVFPDIGHVQIYSGNGNIIEAATTGTNVREVPMWGFWTARRVV